MTRSITFVLSVLLFIFNNNVSHARNIDPCSDTVSGVTRAPIIRYLNYIDRNNAEDALQKALVKLYETCKSVIIVKNANAWVQDAGKKLLFNMLRGEKRQRALETAIYLDSEKAHSLIYLNARDSAIKRTFVFEENNKSDISLNLLAKDISVASRKLAESASGEQLNAMYHKYAEDRTAFDIAN
jgi:DNA-directed RNA polymerase specialized sigma24 family protein